MAEAIGALAVRIGADASELIEAFNKADKALDKFSKNIDRRLLKPMASAAAASIAAGAGILAFAKHAADMVDELGKLSQKVGMSVESLSALKYAADLSDVSIEQLRTGLTQLSKNM